MKNIKPYEKYKPSGIAWLGDIPEHWEVKKLKSFSSLKARIGFHGLNSTHFINEGPFCITGTDFKNGKIDFKNCYHVEDYWYNLDDNIKIQNGDILVTKDGTIGKIAIVDSLIGKATLNSGVFVLRPSLNSRNFYWQLNSKVFRIQMDLISKGSTINHLYERDFRNFQFPIPNPTEQTAIANFLDYKLAKIDRFIKKKKQLIKLLNEQKAGIINDAVTKGLDANVKMKSSGIEWLGDIPAHWEVRKLKGICNAFGRIGFRGYKTTDLVGKGEGAITISPSNMKEDFMIFEKCTYLSWEKYEESPEIKIFNDDVIMVKTGSTYGKVGIVKDLDEMATINPQLLVLKNISISPNYLYLLLKSKLIQSQVKTEVIGSTIPTISQTKILNFNLVLPSKEEIETILIYIQKETTKLYQAIATIEKEIVLVQEYRTTLIAEAVTGKIDVRGYDIPVLAEMDSDEEMEDELEMVAEDGEVYETSEIE